VDTLGAQDLIKTIAAARLIGAEYILGGIRPQIAQTIVRLGLKLNPKATIADALALAFRRSGKAVLDRSVGNATRVASCFPQAGSVSVEPVSASLIQRTIR